MITHQSLGSTAFARSKKLYQLVKERIITVSGNRSLKIYGLLSCSSGKRMKIENRVFFGSTTEAAKAGYRPCGHCMKAAYRQWKEGQDKLRHK